MVVTTRQRENEDEHACALRLRQAAAAAGNVFDQTTLRSIYVDGLAGYVQDSLRIQLTRKMSFSQVQRMAHQLGKSLRSTADRSSMLKQKPPLPAARSVARPVKAFAVVENEEETSPSEVSAQADLEEGEDAFLAASPRYPYGYNRSSPRSSSPRADNSVISIPTRGWESPTASVVSAPTGGRRQPRTVTRPPLCFACYQKGHFLMDCPHLPGPVREFAVALRARYLGHTPPGQRDPWTGPAPVPTQLPRPKAADQPVEAALEADVLEGEPEEVVLSSSGHPAAGPKNSQGSTERRVLPPLGH